ncbi:MAG TPA: hypothetical protein VFG25_00325 [Nitrosopumilaceae archaeon]|nr:hypothetical protein [Nitrosopumilaceae archaeon]
MPDEFTKVARQEINDELEKHSKILQSCKNDDDVIKNSSEIEKQLHKIKGLAPMMGQQQIGEIASINDSLIKKIIDGNKIAGIFETMNKSHQLMKELMSDSSKDVSEFLKNIKNTHSEFLK